MFYTYVLKSYKDNKLYIGWTNDLKNRVLKHQMCLVRSTKGRGILKLVYYEACLSKQKAIEREKFFKSGYGRRYLSKRI